MKKTLTSQRAKLFVIPLIKGRQSLNLLLNILILITFISLPLSLSAQGDNERFTLDLKNATIAQLIETIQESSAYSFFYKDNEINKNDRVSVQISNGTIGEVLSRAFANTDVSYRVQDKHIILGKKEATPQAATSTRVTVKGVVMTETGQPMPGVTVTVPGTIIGVSTDIDGWYIIEVPNREQKLEFSFIGYDMQSEYVGQRTSINVVLRESSANIDEVVVVGYGSAKRTTLTGSIASVNVADMKTSVPNLSNALQGKVAGVISVQSSGEPGYDNSTFTIRGIGSWTGNNSPLVIVDGVQRDDVNSTYGGSYNNIDPEDIASISLLKDASATAMYGAKGANGVLIITTKRGTVGKPQISLKVESGLTSFTKAPSMLNGTDYMKLFNEARRNDGQTEYYTEAQIRITESGLDPYIYPSINWIDEVYKKFSSVTNVNMNLNGGSDIVRYYLSASFYNQTGQYNVKKENSYNPNLNYNRYDFRSNVDVNVTKTTLLQMNLSAIMVDAQYPGVSAGNLWYLSLATTPVAFPVRYPTGEWAGPTANGGSNPKNEVQNSGYTKEFRPAVQSVFTLNQKLDFVTPGLNAYARFSFDSYSEFDNYRRGYVDLYRVTSRDSDGNLVLGRPVREGENYLSYSSSSTGERVVYTEANISYDRSFGDHTIGAMVLYNMRNRIIGSAGSAIAGIPYRNQSLAGRINYIYKDKYLFEVNGSYTGSENFASGNRFGFFPSVSGGWVVSNESFYNAEDIFNLVKFRASYGIVGNDNIGASVRFPYLSQYEYKRGYGFGATGAGVSGLLETLQGVSNLTWEKSYKSNFGLELGILNKVDIIAEYYMERRKNILIQRSSLPSFAGYSAAIFANMGEMDNKGFEVNIEYNDHIGDLGIRLFSNVTYSKNKIVYMDEPEKEYAYQSTTGTRYGEFYGLISEGLYTQAEIDAAGGTIEQFGNVMRAGDVKYKDINNDGIIDAYDYKFLGKSWFPTWSYGFGVGFNWKNFDLSLFFQGVADVGIMANGSAIAGGDLGASGVGVIPFSGIGQYPNNVITKVLDRWTEENPSQDVWYPRLSYNDNTESNNYLSSTWWMKSGNYLRLKQASLGYTLRTAGLERVGLNYLYFYISGVNLVTFSPFKLWDPELGSNGARYPLNRMITLGVRAQF